MGTKLLCPRCSSLPRHRLLPFVFNRFGLGNDEPLTLLHIGPNSVEARWVREHLPIRKKYGLGLLPSPRVDLVADVRNIPLEDESVDVAIAWHVFEHIPDDRAGFREVARVLRPGASFVMSVPIHPPGNLKTVEGPGLSEALRVERFGHPDHVRACGEDYGDRLSEVGLSVTTLRVDQQLQADIDRFGLSRVHLAWCGTKTGL